MPSRLPECVAVFLVFEVLACGQAAVGLMRFTESFSAGPDGAEHGDKNVSVRVPPAALARDVQIDVEWKEEIVPVRRGVPSGVVIALRTTPAVEFREAIQIHVRFPPRVRGGTLVGYEIQPDGRLRPLDVLGVNAKEGHATFLTFHALKFTWVYPD